MVWLWSRTTYIKHDRSGKFQGKSSDQIGLSCLFCSSMKVHQLPLSSFYWKQARFDWVIQTKMMRSLFLTSLLWCECHQPTLRKQTFQLIALSDRTPAPRCSVTMLITMCYSLRQEAGQNPTSSSALLKSVWTRAEADTGLDKSGKEGQRNISTDKR